MKYGTDKAAITVNDRGNIIVKWNNLWELSPIIQFQGNKFRSKG